MQNLASCLDVTPMATTGNPFSIREDLPALLRLEAILWAYLHNKSPLVPQRSFKALLSLGILALKLLVCPCKLPQLVYVQCFCDTHARVSDGMCQVRAHALACQGHVSTGALMAREIARGNLKLVHDVDFCGISADAAEPPSLQQAGAKLLILLFKQGHVFRGI